MARSTPTIRLQAAFFGQSNNGTYMDMDETLLHNAAEGQVQLRTDPFKPVPAFAEMVEEINKLYHNDNDQPLLSYREFKDGKVQVTGTTSLVNIHPDIESAEALDQAAKDRAIPDFIRDELSQYVGGTSVDVGALVKHLVAPKQQVRVQLTDMEYGNSEFTIVR